MTLKSIQISGFRSYRNLKLDTPLSPSINVILGKNGSGKSNILHAIDFVIRGAYTQLSPSSLQSNLHEGSGRQMLHGFVELLFDNSGNRFPVSSSELSIRRTIGINKDEYHINGKLVPQKQAASYFDHAGFSSSTPLYFVSQDKVQQLANQSNAERLELIQEIAGTKIYQEQREKCDSDLLAAQIGKDSAQAVLDFINQDLDKLEDEKQDLEQYQTKLDTLKAIQYVLYQNSVSQLGEQLDALNKDFESAVQKSKKHSSSTNFYSQKLESLASTILKTQVELQTRQNEHSGYQLDLTNVETALKGMTKQIASKTAQKKSLESEIKRLEKEKQGINQLENQNSTRQTQIQNDLEQEVKKLESIENQLIEKQSQLNLLLQSQKSGDFKNKSQRNSWLNDQIKACRVMINEQKKYLQHLDKELNDPASETTSDSDNDDDNENSTPLIPQINIESDIVTLQSQRDDIVRSRQSLWNKKQQTQSVLNDLHSQQMEIKRKYLATMSFANRNGFKSIQQVVSTPTDFHLGFPQGPIYGPLLSLFSFPPKFQCAIESIAGDSLFHIVCENDTVVSDTLQSMDQHQRKTQSQGRVTCIPLNRIKPNRIVISSSNEQQPVIDQNIVKTTHIPPISQVKTLISVLQPVSDKITPALYQVFGKVLVCKTLKTATTVAQNHNVTCVTLDGDVVRSTGMISGGFRAPSKSRLSNFSAYQAHVEQISSHREILDKVSQELQGHTTQIEKLNSQINSLTQQQFQMEHSQALSTSTQSSILDKTQSDLQERQSKIRAKNSIQKELDRLEKQIESLTQQIKSPFQAQLSITNEKEAISLVQEIPRLKQRQTSVEAVIATLQSELDQILAVSNLQTQDQLDKKMQSNSSRIKTLSSSISILEKQKKKLGESFSLFNQKIAHTATQCETLKEMLATLELESSQLSSSAEEASANNQTQDVQSLISNKSDVLLAREQKLVEIEKLGPVDPSQVSKFAKESLNTLMNLYKTHSTQLRDNFSHINKKAMGQFVALVNQKKVLTQRLVELDKSLKAIQDLLGHLDNEKTHSFSSTLDQINDSFSRFFSILRPEGSAQLVVIRDGSATPVGVGIHVSFHSKSYFGGLGELDVALSPSSSLDSTLDSPSSSSSSSSSIKTTPGPHLSSYSGGQRTLIAIALMFALQSVDSVPLYLLDEIDAALDTMHRRAVSKLIQAASQGTMNDSASLSSQLDEDGEDDEQLQPPKAQFIITTFHPELINVSSKAFAVQFSNHQSTTLPVTKKQALDFVSAETMR